MSNTAVKAKGKKKHNIPGYLFILPSVLFFLFYILYPIGFVGWSSLFSWSTLKNMTFVGMENYIRIFQDKVFLTDYEEFSFLDYHDSADSGGSRIFPGIYNRRTASKRKRYFQNSIFPSGSYVCSSCSYCLGKNAAEPYQGIITHYLSVLGIGGQVNILGMPNTAIFGCIIANIWEWTGWSDRSCMWPECPRSRRI